MADQWELSDGEKQEAALRAGGFNDNDIAQWKTNTYNDLTASGGEEVAKHYFGIREPNMAPMDDYIRKNLADNPIPKLGPDASPEQYAGNAIEAFKSGLQSGAYGLLERGKSPDILVAESAPFAAHFAQATGQLVSDATVGMAGYLATAGVFAAAGVSLPALLPIAATVGTAAYVRRYLMDQYANGGFKDGGDYAARVGTTLMGTAEEMASVAAGEGAGKFTGQLLAKTMLPPVVQTSVKLAATGAGMSFAASGMRGELPSKQDVALSAAFIGAFHGVAEIPRFSRNLADWYSKTGEKPLDVAQKIESDPKLAQSIVAPTDQMSFDLLTLDTSVQGVLELEGKTEPPMIERNFLQREIGPELLPKYITDELNAYTQTEMSKSITEPKYKNMPVDEIAMNKAVEGLQQKRQSLVDERNLLSTKMLDLRDTGYNLKPEQERIQGLVKQIRKIDTQLQDFATEIRRRNNENLYKKQVPLGYQDVTIIRENIQAEKTKLEVEKIKLNALAEKTDAQLARLQEISKKQRHLDLKDKYLEKRAEKLNGKIRGTKYRVENQLPMQHNFFEAKYLEEQRKARIAKYEKIQGLKERQAAGEELNPADIAFLEESKNINPEYQNLLDQLYKEDLGQGEFDLAKNPPPFEKVAFGEQMDLDFNPESLEDAYGQLMLGTEMGWSIKPPEEPPIHTPVPEPENGPPNGSEVLNEMMLKALSPTKKKFSWSQFRYDLADEFINTKKAIADIYKNKQLPLAEKNAYVLQRLFRSWNDKANYWHQFGPTDYATGKPTGTRGYAEIVKPFEKDGSVFELEKYRVGKRILEKEAQGISSGKNPEELAAIKTFLDENKAKFEKASKELTQWNNDGLKYLLDSGLLSKEAYENVLKNNDSYVFFKRIYGETDNFNGFSSEHPIRKMTGVEMGDNSKILSPARSEYTRMKAIIRLSERQRVLNSIIELAKDDVEGQYIYETTKGAEGNSNKLDLDEIMKIVDEEANKLELENNPTKDNLEKSKSPPLVDDTGRLVIMQDGAPRFFQVKDELLESLKNMDDSYRITNSVGKFAVKIGRTARAGVIKTPVYVIKNIIKDAPNTWVMSKYGYNPFIHGFEAFMDVFRQNEVFKNYLREGGPAGSALEFFDQNGNYIYERSKYDNTWNLIKSVPDFFEKISLAAEHAPRVAEFKLALEKGASRQEAILASKEIGVDFSMKGASNMSKAWRELTPFSGAGVSALNKLVSEFYEGGTTNFNMDPKYRQQKAIALAAKAASIISVPTAMLYLWNRNQPLYQHASKYDKDTKFGLPINIWKPMDADHAGVPDYLKRKNEDGVEEYNAGYMIWLPKPQELGMWFGTSVEHILDQFLADHPEENENLIKLIGKSMIPNYLPTSVDLGLTASSMLMNDKTGYDVRTWSQTVPAYLQDQLPADRYLPETSEVAKAISSFLTKIPYAANRGIIAPVNIDLLMDKWTGGAAGLLSELSVDIPAKWGERPEGDALWKSSLVRGMFKRYPYPNPEELDVFRKKAADIEQEYASYKNALVNSDDPKAYEIELKYGPILGRFTGYSRAIGNIQAAIRATEVNKDMLPYEKRQAIDSYLYDMAGILQDGVGYIRENEKEVAKAQKEMQILNYKGVNK